MAQQGLLQIQVLKDGVRDRGEVHSHNETAQTPLLEHSHHSSAAGSRSKLRRTCCIKSKAATAILCLNLLMAFGMGYMLQIIIITIIDVLHVYGSDGTSIVREMNPDNACHYAKDYYLLQLGAGVII